MNRPLAHFGKVADIIHDQMRKAFEKEKKQLKENEEEIINTMVREKIKKFYQKLHKKLQWAKRKI